MPQKKFAFNLLFVISSLGGGGAERVLVDLINHLDSQKYNIMLVVIENIDDLQKDLPSHIKVVYLGKTKRWDFFKLVIKLINIIRKFSPNAIISFLHYSNLVTGIASIFQGKKSVLVLCEHSYPPKDLEKKKFNAIRKYLMQHTFNKADAIVAVSEKIREYLINEFKLKPHKIKTIYNPVILKVIQQKSSIKVEHPFFFENNTKILISVGRLSEEKRFDLLLEAFSIVKKEHKNTRLIILGKGDLKRELQNLAEKLNISKYIDFVGFKDNPYAWISKADMFILCSDYEGFPVVLLEAMACGTPIISANCPSGPGEIVTNNQNGILVPPGDKKAIAKAISYLLEKEDLRKIFSQKGRKSVQDFAIENITQKFEELFSIAKNSN